jgi:hypothetical protein
VILLKKMFLLALAFVFVAAGSASFARFASAALLIPNCADVLRVYHNEQKIMTSLEVDTGQPETITVTGKDGMFFWFEDGYNGSSAFDVVVREPYGFLKPGDVLFKQGGETAYYSKDADAKVFYDCSEKGADKRDSFAFEVGANKSFNLVDGKSFAADYVKIKSDNNKAFRLRDDYTANEFYVTASSVLQGAVDYGAGSVFFESPSAPGKFEEYYAYSLGKQYARIPYIGCCAEPFATLAPSPAPSAEACVFDAAQGACCKAGVCNAAFVTCAEGFAPGGAEGCTPDCLVKLKCVPIAPSIAPAASPTPCATPSPILEKPARDFNHGTGGLLTALVFVIVYAAFAAAAFFLLQGKHVGVEIKKGKPLRKAK